MTWTYFTAYLDGSRPIAKTERDELYTNLSAVLATSGCSAAGYSLNSTDQTAIKGSNLITDRASLDGPGATNTKARLHTVLETAASAFSNYSSAVSAALSAEGLTSTTRGEIISANTDDHRLWNYYRRVIDGLTCCSVPVVTSASPSGCAGVAFSYNISATNSPTSYGATGLPPGLVVNTSSGAITGTPTTNGTYSVAVSATNACGTGNGTLTITIGGGSMVDMDLYSGENGPTPVDCIDQTQTVDTFACATDAELTSYITGGYGVQVVVKANGSTIYDSGCVTSPPSATISIPAGTTSIRVIVTCACDSASGDEVGVLLQIP